MRLDAPAQTPAREEPASAARPPRWAWALPGVALLVVLGAVIATLSHTEPRLAGSNNVRLVGYPVEIPPGERYCQSGERVPPDAASMQLQAGTEGRPGPPLAVTVGARKVAVPGGYHDGPLRVELPRSGLPSATVCVENLGKRRVYLGGQTAASAIPPGVGATLEGGPLPLAASVLYWRAGRESGWQVAGAVLDRWSVGTALDELTPWLAISLMVAACVAAIAVAARGRARAVVCAAIATAAAAAWAFTTPAFHVPDEPQHIAYAQYLAETGKLPRPVRGLVFSQEEGAAFGSMRLNHVFGNPTGRPPWQVEEDRAIDAALAAEPGRLPDGGWTNTSNNPPLYYGLQVLPLKLASSGSFLDRFLAMRLLSALLAGLTAGFAFLFLRELLPGSPWAWGPGALAVALQPLVGFISGAVNNDAGMMAAGAAIMWLVARALRRGLNTATAVGIGAAVGLGVLMKATLVGLAPGLLVVLCILLVRSDNRARTLRLAGVALGVAAAPVVAYALLSATVWDRPLWSAGPGSEGPIAARPKSSREFLSYLWQFYLPRLPFMTDMQVGLPLYNVWFKGFIGTFGWLDTAFPEWVYTVAASVFTIVLALAAAMFARARRWADLLVYSALVAGLLLVVGWAGYDGRIANGFIFEQSRYLFPLIALYGALIAVATTAGGRRLGPALGTTFVVLACGHALFSILLVVGRFYV